MLLSFIRRRSIQRIHSVEGAFPVRHLTVTVRGRSGKIGQVWWLFRRRGVNEVEIGIRSGPA
jgi:hypothetical protein